MGILNKLTIKHLTMNKKRTIVTIIGVILSTALMVGIGLIFASLRENTIQDVIANNGRYHTSYYDIAYEKLPILEKNPSISTVFYKHSLGYAYLDGIENDYKPYLQILEVNDSYYEELKFIAGRKPKNQNEFVISEHIKSNGGVTLELGSTITLEYGRRYIDRNGERFYISDREGLDLEEGEQLEIIGTKTYTIVGIVERSPYEDYSSPGYSVFTTVGTLETSDLITSYIIFKNNKNIYDKSNDIAENLGLKKYEDGDFVFYDNMDTNSALISLYGESQYGNLNDAIVKITAIILSIISVGCIIVIYNSFAISVMERKKLFGLFSSIGATRAQIRKTVFFEAFIIALIGIPLGVLSAYLGIGIVIEIINYLVPELLGYDLVLATYPPLIIVPLLFMVIVIIASAYLPAKRASKVTPIEAIRQNDDIKIKKEKIKTGKWVRKIFGIEGEIALKNMKRNKKKYRITVISLFISIVMFVTFSSLLDYGLRGT